MRRFSVRVATLPVALTFCVGLAACSRYLEVRVHNTSGAALTVCSYDGKPNDCRDIPDGGSIVLKWLTGTFVVKGTACAALYQAPVPEAIEDFRTRPQEPLNAVVNRDRLFLLIHNGQSLEAATPENQPKGFPVSPMRFEGTCEQELLPRQ